MKLPSRTNADGTRRRPWSSRKLGIVLLAVVLAFGLYAFNRSKVDVTLHSGEHLKAQFSRQYKLQPYQSVVKLAGVKVGTVTGVDSVAGHGSTVSMKLDDGTLAKLGTAPKATIRPTLLLGGSYYVELAPGGNGGSSSATIPVSRTAVPVELDRVLQAFTPDARASVPRTVSSLDETLRKPGRKAARKLVTVAPDALAPTGQVLTAAEGTHPDSDLSNLVVSARRIGATLTAQQGQLSSILDSLDTTTTALAAQRGAVADTLAQAPDTLSTTRAGLADLDPTLDRLTVTATAFRPAAQRLGPLLGKLDPTLQRARPVIADAREVVASARPLVSQLVPTVGEAQDDLSDIKGPVLDRAKGPILQAVLSPWHGTGKYAGGGNDHPLYKETGYLLAHTDNVFKFHDAQGAAGRLMAGVGLQSVGGVVDMSLEQLLEKLGLDLPAGPQENGAGSNVLGLASVPSVGTSGGSGGSSAPAGTQGPDSAGTLGGSVTGLAQDLLLPLVSGSN